jgi:glycosyltransferase involved in cell wall biosynthesis
MTPRVSIIIPVFNGESFIARALESCLGQEYDNIEIVVIDDGSTDGTASIVKKYLERGVVSYIYQENSERSAARNRGVRICNGEYIQFLDADDELLPGKISSQVQILETDASLAAVYSSTVFQKNGQKLKKIFYEPKLSFVKDMIVSNFIPINALLFRKGALHAFDEGVRLLEDWKLLLQVLADGHNFVGIAKPLCVVNIHSNNSSRDRTEMATAELKILSWVENHPKLSINKDAICFAKAMRFYELGMITSYSLIQSVWQDARVFLISAIIFATKYKVKKLIGKI